MLHLQPLPLPDRLHRHSVAVACASADTPADLLSSYISQADKPNCYFYPCICVWQSASLQGEGPAGAGGAGAGSAEAAVACALGAWSASLPPSLPGWWNGARARALLCRWSPSLCFPVLAVIGAMRNPTAVSEGRAVNFDEEAGMTEALIIDGPIPEEEEEAALEVRVTIPETGPAAQAVHSASTASPRSHSDTSFSGWTVPSSTPRDQEGITEQHPQASTSSGQHNGNPARPAEQSAQIKSDIRSRIPGLVALTLPTSPSGQLQNMDDLESDSEGGSDSSGRSAVALLTTRRLAPLATCRLKTRLQEPPPITPAVSNMISRCESTIGQRRVSITSQLAEEAAAGVNNVEYGTNDNTTAHKLPGGRSSMTSMPSVSRAPSRVPSYVGILRTPTSSKSQPFSAAAKIPGANMPSLEEELDPLDDESIPKYKKWKYERNWLVWTQYLALMSLVPLLVCSVYIARLERVRWLSLGLWRWMALALVVISGRLISGWLIKILVVLIERHYLLQKRVLYFVYGLRHAVKNCIWLALVLGVWKVIFDANNKDRHDVSPTVTKILWCLWIASLLWMIKVMAVKVAANSFHRAAYFDRIQDNLFHQFVLGTLSAPASYNTWVNFGTGQAVNMEDAAVGYEDQGVSYNQGGPKTPGAHPGFVPKTPGPSGDANNYDQGGPSHQLHGLPTSRGRLSTGSTVAMPPARQASSHTPAPIIARSPMPIQQDRLQELTSETVSAWTLKRLMKIIRKTNMTTYSSLLSHEHAEWEIGSEVQAKAAAKEIFYNIARPGEKYLHFKDFLNFFQEDTATRAFNLFEVTEAGLITKKALMKWVVSVYKERKALALTLSDNRTVVAKLHRVLDVVLAVILITIFFLILGVNTSKLLVALSSTLLPSVFVFGNCARTTFESLVFLFVMHPFDVGDRISVDGQSFIVEELNILNTIFLSGTNEKIYYPNSVLSTKAISNFYRSPDQWDAIDFQIHVSTPVEKLGILRERMARYIESLPQFWYPVFRIVCKDIQDSNKMIMSLWMQHHLNYQEAGERWQRRSNMILHMKQQMEELGIGYRLPMADVTVTGVPVLDVPPEVMR